MNQYLYPAYNFHPVCESLSKFDIPVLPSHLRQYSRSIMTPCSGASQFLLIMDCVCYNLIEVH